MTLTHASRTPHDSNSFPAVQLLILGTIPHTSTTSLLNMIADSPSIAICRVAEPIALASCFPYAWVMVRDFHVGDRHNASFYAGIFISAFAFAESLTGMLWGGLSDRIGRKPVLLVGCGGTLVSLLIVGFSTNFWVALAGRALGGLLSEIYTGYTDLSTSTNLIQMETSESFRPWSEK